MKKELEEKLFKKYPKIFRQKDLSMAETCMCWGIGTGDGWYNLIDMLCSQLQFNTDKNKYPQVEAVQVKEKFGTLRFYYNVLSKKEDKYFERHSGVIEGLVDFAEFLSGSICEGCGINQEITQTKGWISTLCKKCLQKRKDKGL